MEILISVFLMSLFSGVHCLGMCGGIVGLLSAGVDENIRKDKKQIALLHLNYNFGRILSYVLMGLIFGIIGSFLSSLVQMNIFDKLLRMFSGVLMIMVGLYIGSWSNAMQIVEKMGSKLWNKIQPISQKFLPVRNAKKCFCHWSFLGLDTLWACL